MQAVDQDEHTLGIITVTYNPDMSILRKQLSQLPASATRIIIDNASQSTNLESLRLLAAEHKAQLLPNNQNMGLATATNQGIALALKARCGFVMLLDQDTEPGINGVLQLLAAYQRLREAGSAVGCMGPRLIDAATGLEHGFHVIRGWRWVREFPSGETTVPIRCANLNGSGTLIPVEVLDSLGGLEDALFIDHVDTDWSFRVLAAGFSLYGAPNVSFLHRMGEHSLRFWWFGWRVWPYRSPLRHRYLFRNAIWLMRRRYVPMTWKAWAVLKLILTMAVHLLFDQARRSQAAEMFRGIRDGFCNSASTQNK